VSALECQTVRISRYLQPGQLYVSRTPAALSTILGSCVAVCMWDAREGIGGMNHFMLPQFAGSGIRSARFGNIALQELLDKMVAAGARRNAISAHVFGGACMFEQLASAHHLGLKNIELALDFLTKNRIDVVQKNVGGSRGRKLHFQTDDGVAWMNLI
jgi:chemotaxis protein CheD